RSMGDCLREQPVRKPRVSRQQRPVQVGANGATEPAALVAALTVVAEAGYDAPKRFRARIEDRPAGVVLESGQRLLRGRLELALEQNVADHAPGAGDRVERQEADARQLLAALVAIEAAEQLVAATDGEEGSSSLEGVV